MGEDDFDFRAEQQSLGREFVIERLDAEAIAGDEEGFRVAVPDGKREHAAQVIDAVGPVLLEGVNDGFGVAVSAVLVAASDELFAQGLVVVDFAVEDDPERAIFIRERLVAGGEIDNAEAAHADAEAAIDVKALVVRPAVSHDVAHLAQRGAVGPGIASKFENSCNAAHSVFLRVGRGARRVG